MFSLPENLGVVAAFQRCPTPRLLACVRLRGRSIVHMFFFSNFFIKPLGNIHMEGIQIYHDSNNTPSRKSLIANRVKSNGFRPFPFDFF